MEDAPATAAAMALCRMVTPLETPEDPLVYMTQARSSGCGGICLAGLSSPNYFSSLYERRRTCGKQSRKFLVSKSAVDVWFTMTNSRLGTSGRTLARLTSSVTATKMARNAVCPRSAQAIEAECVVRGHNSHGLRERCVGDRHPRETSSAVKV
jgi:hypothetical protein